MEDAGGPSPDTGIPPEPLPSPGPIRFAGGPDLRGTLIDEDHNRIGGGAATAVPRRGVPDTVPG